MVMVKTVLKRGCVAASVLVIGCDRSHHVYAIRGSKVRRSSRECCGSHVEYSYLLCLVPTHSSMASHVQSSSETWEEEKKKRDQLSSLMGGYLLKGYKMLGTNCPVCGMILMRTPRDGIDYCIQCSELDGKDPVPADNTKAGEQAATILTQEPSPTMAGDGSETIALARDTVHEVLGDISVCNRSTPSKTLRPSTLLITEKILLTKIRWASQELANSTSIEHCTQLCILVKTCADAIKSVGEINLSTRTE